MCHNRTNQYMIYINKIAHHSIMCMTTKICILNFPLMKFKIYICNKIQI